MFKREKVPDYGFFSVDVETSGLVPGHGELLTIGIVPVVYAGRNRWVDLWTDDNTLYIRIDQGTEFPDGPYSSMGFWKKQSKAVRDEAYADRTLERFSPNDAAKTINDYLDSFEPDPMKRFFVANPVSFDKPWIDKLFADAGLPLPFHYRSLCLRSMDFGKKRHKGFGGSRDGHNSEVLHHALWDAKAQAMDLVDMLNKKRFWLL